MAGSAVGLLRREINLLDEREPNGGQGTLWSRLIYFQAAGDIRDVEKHRLIERFCRADDVGDTVFVDTAVLVPDDGFGHGSVDQGFAGRGGNQPIIVAIHRLR